MVAQYLPRVLKASWKVLTNLRGEIGFRESWGGWAEVGLLVLLLGAEGMGLSWDGGLLDVCVEDFLTKYEDKFIGKEGKAEEGNRKGAVVEVEGKN